MKATRSKKQYTAEFKAQAVELMAAGRPVAELAEEQLVSVNLLYSWRSSSQGARIALLRQENDISKKAAVILGTRPHPNFVKQSKTSTAR